eukprot:CCRYP_003115-RB/>CCRYP_003115-RB protein AED:0.07 eAED:0.14 QI:0/0.5/0.4/1/0.5/0.4/5/1706/938
MFWKPLLVWLETGNSEEAPSTPTSPDVGQACKSLRKTTSHQITPYHPTCHSLVCIPFSLNIIYCIYLALEKQRRKRTQLNIRKKAEFERGREGTWARRATLSTAEKSLVSSMDDPSQTDGDGEDTAAASCVTSTPRLTPRISPSAASASSPTPSSPSNSDAHKEAASPTIQYGAFATATNAQHADSFIMQDGPASPSTPTRQRSKSVTHLASGCGVSPLNPFHSPLSRTASPMSMVGSPIKDYDPDEEDNNVMELQQDSFFWGNDLYFDENHYQHHREHTNCDDVLEELAMGSLRPIRRHTIAGATEQSPTQQQQQHQHPKHALKLKESMENEQQQQQQQQQDGKRSTLTTQATTANWEDDNLYPIPEIAPYRYCICSDIFMKILRRICRPHVDGPSCLRPCFPRCQSRMDPRHRRLVCRSVIILFMIVTITFTLLDLLILHKYLNVWLEGTLDWLANNPVAGGMAFIGIILTASLCFFPVSLLALGAGYVYIDLYGLGVGITAAFFVCYAGSLLGAAVCFARSRYLMRQLIQKFSNRYPIVRAVDRAFATMGFRLFLLLRLSPAMPFNALNYIGGITAVSFRDYWRATCIGITPGLLWTIFVGATFGTINNRGVDGKDEFDRDSIRKGVVLGLGIGLGVMGLIGTAMYARQELTKIILAEQASEETETSNPEEAAAHQAPRPHGDSGESFQSPIHDNSSNIFRDLENPQLGESHHSSDEVDPSNRGLFLDESEKSLHNGGVVGQRKENLPARHPPWSPEAIAMELPLVPPIFRRRGSVDLFDLMSPSPNHQTSPNKKYPDITTTNEPSKPEPATEQSSKPLELHMSERVFDVSYNPIHSGTHRSHHVKGQANRPRSNTDPVVIQNLISQTDPFPGGKGDNPQNESVDTTIRRLHSMADFESLRASATAGPGQNASPDERRDEALHEGFDREWFWIWY